MKIYFAASIRGGRDNIDIYKQLISHLSQKYHLLTEHIGDDSLSDQGEKELSDNEIRDRDIEWIEASNLVIAETTQPSLGVGYELAYAERIAKPVIILHRKGDKQLSAMIAGTQYFNRIIHYSTAEEAIELLDKELEQGIEKELTNEFIAKSFSLSDFQVTYPYLDETISWRTVGEEPIVGKQAVIDHTQQVRQYFNTIETDFEVEEVIGTDNKIIVTGVGRFNNQGNKSRVDACDIYSFNNDGLLVSIESYCVPIEE